MVKEVVGLLLGEDVCEVVETEKFEGRVADNSLRVLAGISHSEASIGFFTYSKQEAEPLDGTGGVDRLVLAPLQRSIPSCDNQMPFIGHDMFES